MEVLNTGAGPNVIQTSERPEGMEAPLDFGLYPRFVMLMATPSNPCYGKNSGSAWSILGSIIVYCLGTSSFLLISSASITVTDL